MTLITITNSNEWLYLTLFLLCIYLMITYIKPFNAKDLIESFLYLINKFILLLLTLIFMFAFIFEIIGESTKTISFITSNFKVLIYYLLLNYSLFYGFKLINWMKNFYKDNDLLNIKYFEKLEKESNKK